VWPSNKTGVWRYHDHHGRGGEEWLSLAEVHASRYSGQLVQFRKKGEEFDNKPSPPSPAEARWWLRLWYDVGLLEVNPVPLQLGFGASEVERKLAEGFALLLALRYTKEMGPIPFTRSFASSWCGVSNWQAGQGISNLVRRGVIYKEDVYRMPSGHDLNLYLPGVVVKTPPSPKHHSLVEYVSLGRQITERAS
jgi:hypothetical protein